MSDNPFQMPDSDPRDQAPAPDGFHAPLTCAAGQGSAWFSQGWRLFTRKPLMLAAMTLLMFLVVGILSLIPLLGGVVVALFWPHLMAGLYLAIEHADRGEAVSMGDLFRPLRDPGYLLGVGALILGAQIVMTLISMVFALGGMGMGGLMSALSHPQAVDAPMFMTAGGFLWVLLGLLVVLALSIPLGMAVLFAPILTYRHRVSPLEALKLSFQGCWKNMLPFLTWSLVWLLAAIALVLIFLLPFIGALLAIVAGFFIFPLTMANLYCAWKDIYVR